MIAISGAGTPFGKSLLSAIDNKADTLQIEATPDSNKGFFVDFFKTEKPSVFINLSQIQNIDEAEYNPEKAYNLHSYRVRDSAQAAAENNCIYVLLSSAYIFNGKNLNQYTEDDMPEPVSVYADSILLGENFLKKSGCSYLIIRTGDLFGNETGISSQRFIKKDNGSNLKVIRNLNISPTYMPDAAQAVLDLINMNASGIYNICNSGSIKAHGFIKKAFEFIQGAGNNNLPEITESDLWDLRFSAERPLNTTLSDKKFLLKTGKGLRSWEDALKNYIESNQITEI
jgi:dTDP-4-dehydrorhamnose reductase